MASTAPGIFVTVPKYVATNSISPTLPKLRPSPVTAAMLKAVGGFSPTSSSGYASSNSGAEDTASPKGKKRRLDHLTWEEKVQRKKLKNRVAAQTSRDRKKARMEEMEFEIKDLTEKTEILQNKCESLQVINDSLLAKNNKLDMEVELLRQELNEIKEKQNNSIAQPSTHSAVVQSCAGCASINNGSAVSNTDPLPQGTPMDTQSTHSVLEQQLQKSNTLASLWKIVALCLLYKTCYSTSKTMKNSMQEGLKSWPKVCSPISQQTWKQALERAMKLLPKLQATQSDCLDQWWGPQQSAWNPAEIEIMG